MRRLYVKKELPTLWEKVMNKTDNIEDKKKEIVKLLYNDAIVWEYNVNGYYTAEFESVKGASSINLIVRVGRDGDIYIGDNYIRRDTILLNKISEQVSKRQYQRQAELLDLFIEILGGE